MGDNTHQTLQIGTIIQDKWVILEFLGRGGMGQVYRAHQINLKRDIAIKIISREWLASLEDDEEEIEIGLQRFRNEVLTMAQVRHPNIVQIYDCGSFSVRKEEEPLSMEYIAIEYIPGGTLRSTMSEEGFYPEEELVRDWAMKYFFPVLDGIQALHSAGIIHRDLKPENVLMDGDTPKISDFGLARSSRIKPVTTSVEMKGTPSYMSPEHFMDFKRADHRADVYSLGKILFEAIDGKMGPHTLPFKSARLGKTGTPFFDKLDQVIGKASAEDRNSRFGSVEEFKAAILDALKAEESDGKIEQPRRPTRIDILYHPKSLWAGIAVAVILVLAMTLWHFFSGPQKTFLGPDRSPPTSNDDIISSEPSPPRQASTPAPLSSQSVLTGGDGAKLHLIPGGGLPLPNRSGQETGKPLRMDSFFMDETEVTNHQYVEFLNKVLKTIRVEGETVKAGGNVWLLLGEAAKDYEPILFRDGKFVLKDPLYHSHPVVRVSAFAAKAYAEYYGRRLPTSEEWLYAVRLGGGTQGEVLGPLKDQDARLHMERMHEELPLTSSNDLSLPGKPVSVADSPPNKYGIRGLQGNVNEWGVVLPQIGQANDYVVLPQVVKRQPWEAFENVGFRTVLPFSN